MKVKPIEGEILRYHVTSEKNPANLYLVDLEEYWGVGWCACPHFAFDIEPTLSRFGSKPEKPDDFRCKHIAIARRFAGRRLLNHYINVRNHQQFAVDQGSHGA